MYNIYINFEQTNKKRIFFYLLNRKIKCFFIFKEKRREEMIWMNELKLCFVFFLLIQFLLSIFCIKLVMSFDCMCFLHVFRVVVVVLVGQVYAASYFEVIIVTNSFLKKKNKKLDILRIMVILGGGIFTARTFFKRIKYKFLSQTKKIHVLPMILW